MSSTPSSRSKSKSKSKSKAKAKASPTTASPTASKKPQPQARQGLSQQELLLLLQKHRQQSASSKLRPIYAALDSRNYTRAVKLAQHKSLHDWPIVCALRAHCLNRIGGRDEEARAALAEVLGYPVSSDCDLERDGGGEDGEELDVAELLESPLHADYLPGMAAPLRTTNDDDNRSPAPLDETTLSTVAVTLRSMNADKCLRRMYEDASSFASTRLASGGMSAEERAVTTEEQASALRGLFSAHLRAALRLQLGMRETGIGSAKNGIGWHSTLSNTRRKQWIILGCTPDHYYRVGEKFPKHRSRWRRRRRRPIRLGTTKPCRRPLWPWQVPRVKTTSSSGP